MFARCNVTFEARCTTLKQHARINADKQSFQILWNGQDTFAANGVAMEPLKQISTVIASPFLHGGNSVKTSVATHAIE